MGRGVAEIGHPPPDDEAAERRRRPAPRRCPASAARTRKSSSIRGLVGGCAGMRAAAWSCVCDGRGGAGRAPARRRVPSPNSARYSGAWPTTSGVPSQQTWPFRQITRSDALITTCRSWLTISTAQPVSAPHLLDQAVEGGRAGLVQPLRRLVEDQQVRPPSSARASSTRWNCPPDRRRHLPLAEPGHAGPRQRRLRRPAGARAAAGRGSAPTRHRQRRVEHQLLRHVADPQPRRAPDRARPTAAPPPISARSSVDLPDPFGPTMVTISPRLDAQVDVVQHRPPP